MIDYTGESRQLRIEGGSGKFWTTMGLATILIFLVLAAQFNSFRDPMVILLGSVPLALDEAVRSGRIQRGQMVLLEAFGGGFTWGAVLLDY